MTTPESDDPGCVFCRTPAQEILFSDGCWYARFDRHPVTPGHILAIPVRHCPEFSDLDADENLKLLPFITRCREFVDARFHPQGYNMGANLGTAAGQTVSHIHVHIIPRYLGDHPDPRGGIRAVIPGCSLLPFTERITQITGIPDALCIEESFADLTEDTGSEMILRAGASEALLVTDGESVPLALALKTPEGWRISSALLNRKDNTVRERFSAVGGRVCRTTRPLWMAALKEYYSRKIIGTIPPMTSMIQTGRTEILHALLEDTLGGDG